MKRPDQPPSFFGLDLHQLRSDWAFALSQIALWPVFRWLAPVYATRITMTNGDIADWTEGTDQVTSKRVSTKSVKFMGFLLPEDQVLWFPMTLPNLKADALHSAMELQVSSLSPFLPADMIWSHTPLTSTLDGVRTYVVIASRKIISRYLISVRADQSKPDDYEVWVQAPESRGFLVLNGFGENIRRRLAARWRVVNLCLVFFLVAIGFAAALTPMAQLRFRAIQASEDFAKLQVLAASALHQRERFVQLDQQVKALQAPIEQRLQPELVLLNVTKLLADDTYVISMQVQGSKIVMTGQTPNTASLMQQLGSQLGIKDVRAPYPATKQKGADRETFNIEFTLDPASAVAKL